MQRGIVAVESLAEVENVFAWLADDGTVRMVNGTVMSKISDLDLETRIAGDGTLRRKGTIALSDAYAFWIDSTIYKTYNLTIPSLGITWVYDLMTGKSHIRESRNLGVWRGVSSGSFNGKALVCGFDSNQIYFVDVNAFDEGGEILAATIGMPSISFDVNVNIPLIEVDMEVGVGLNTGQGSNPKMIVEYSKDGGITFTNWGSIDLGKIGEYRKRVPMRLFGQLVRHKDFIVQYRITDPVEVTIYGHYFDIKGG